MHTEGLWQNCHVNASLLKQCHFLRVSSFLTFHLFAIGIENTYWLLTTGRALSLAMLQRIVRPPLSESLPLLLLLNWWNKPNKPKLAGIPFKVGANNSFLSQHTQKILPRFHSCKKFNSLVCPSDRWKLRCNTITTHCIMQSGGNLYLVELWWEFI